jgi:hypothetical protein
MKERRAAYRLWWEYLRERDHLGDPGVDGDNIKMNLQEGGWRGMDWIDLAENRDRRRVLENAVMNFRFP